MLKIKCKNRRWMNIFVNGAQVVKTAIAGPGRACRLVGGQGASGIYTRGAHRHARV